jgi:putative protease
MKRKIELLAPGGDIDSIKAAIVAGADAIYCGLNNFNARNRATNIELDDLNGIVSLAHDNDCQVFLTINIIIIESEIRALVNLLNKLENTQIDGVIVQDLGLFYILAKHYKNLKIHASTQLTTHNAGQIKFLTKLTATRVNLSRELNLEEITTLTRAGHENNVQSEVFVHGSNCIGFSGICYLSSVMEGKSGNRGRCSQPCREQYLTTAVGKNFPLNLKDNSAFNDLQALYDAGVDSVKIEGRMKKFHYVYSVVSSWRKLLDNFYNFNKATSNDTDLYRVFNRDFTNSFLQGDINKNMFIDNPRDNSALYFSEIKGCTSDAGIEETKKELHVARTKIITHVRNKIADLIITKSPLKMSIDGASGAPFKIALKAADVTTTKPILSVLISSVQQLNLCRQTNAELYFQLPNCFNGEHAELVKLFLDNEELTPWFPAVIIGKDYAAAVALLQQVKPQRIVTNNSGIAYEAHKQGIAWIAGPYLNTVNSLSLLCLKENFNCSGAFLANEISRNQLKNIVAPENFKLYYSIYHPILLLTSRQCLAHQIEGCEKSVIDDECMQICNRSSSITNMKDRTLFVDKTAGCYHRIYNNDKLLNTDIVSDMPNVFTSFFIDLTEITTETKIAGDNVHIIKLFERLLNGDSAAKKELEKTIHPTTNIQYQKGI